MNLSGVYLKKTSYWPQKTINPYKVFIFFSLTLALGLTMNHLMFQKPTDSYMTKARQLNKNGAVLTYDESGTISIMIYRHTNTTIHFTLSLATSLKEKARCDANIKTLNATTKEDGNKKETSFFTYTDPCLISLPNGLYKAIIQEVGYQDITLEFEVTNGMLKQ